MRLIPLLLLGLALATRADVSSDATPTTPPAGDPAALTPEVRAAGARGLEAAGAGLRLLQEELVRRLYPYGRVRPEMLLPHLVAEFTQQFRALLATELRFIDRVCHPSPPERAALEAAGREGLRLLVEDYAEKQVRMEQWFMRLGNNVEWPDPREGVPAALLKAAEATLAPEVARRYRLALEERAASRKRATILYLVAKIDKKLRLSAEQRRRLVEVVSSSWQDSWSRRLEYLHYGDDYVPILPEEQVASLLSEGQLARWQAWEKRDNDVRGWTGYWFFHPVESIADLEPSEVTPEADDQGAKGAEPAAGQAAATGKKPSEKEAERQQEKPTEKQTDSQEPKAEEKQ